VQAATLMFEPPPGTWTWAVNVRPPFVPSLDHEISFASLLFRIFVTIFRGGAEVESLKKEPASLEIELKVVSVSFVDLRVATKPSPTWWTRIIDRGRQWFLPVPEDAHST
jgi:hypothetical protein